MNLTNSDKIKLIQKGLAQKTLIGFVYATNPNYLMGWVHEEVCFKLDSFLSDVVAKKNPRLVITMPPRSGKSQLASRAFPAYAFGRYPDISIISAFYSADLASRMNRDVQRIIESEQYRAIFPDTKLYGKNSRTTANGTWLRNSDIFEIVGHRGSYRSSGVGGGITGMGADILIIDDPIKDREEADSETIRNKIWDWYTSTAYTRLSDGGGVIVMCTRWHEDDMIGRLIERGNNNTGEKFEVINYPAIAETDEPHRKAGEALHPERYSLATLENIKRNIGSRDWAALYQQHPTPEGGAIFNSNWLKFYTPRETPEVFDEVIQSWDMSFKDSVSSDFVVGQVWGKRGASFYLLHQIRGRYDFVASKQRLIELTNAYPQATRKLVEDKANGPAIISDLKDTVMGIVPITPKESKVARANAVAPLFEAGNVYLPDPKTTPWMGDYLNELLTFPSGKHDDQIDSTTMALGYFKKHQPLTLSKETMQKLRTPPRSFYRI